MWGESKTWGMIPKGELAFYQWVVLYIATGSAGNAIWKANKSTKTTEKVVALSASILSTPLKKKIIQQEPGIHHDPISPLDTFLIDPQYRN